MKYKVIVYGIGAEFAKLYNILKYLEITDQIEIVALTAKDIPQYKSIDGYKIINKNSIKNIEHDYIVIMSTKYFHDIRLELIADNLQEEKIIPCSILSIPNLRFDDYIKIKNRNISIISNNCWGGIVYNTLGMKCRSPFKNLFLNDNDYIKI